MQPSFSTPDAIILPPLANPAWVRATEIVAALRAKWLPNPLIVAAVVDAFAESECTAVIQGDRDQSFGPWQMKFAYYGRPIMVGIGVDIRTETSLSRHVDAVLYALSLAANKATLDALKLATTGEQATRLWAGGFERASAGGAVERRVALAPHIEVWLNSLH